MLPRKAIINADDFGWSVGVTDGILEAHRQGVVTSATLVANMPDAERAVGLALAERGLGVGVHLNACQGPPLSDAGRRLAGRDGVMNRTAVALFKACLLRPGLFDAVGAEFEAQIRWALDRGLRPTHLDSHRHVHAFPPIFARTNALARKYDIPFLRWPSERLPGGDWPDRPAKQARVARLLRCMCGINRRAIGAERAGAAGTWGIAHTGLISVAWLLQVASALPEGTTEIMTHPGRPDGLDAGATRLIESRQAELSALCAPAVKDALKEHHVELIHYGSLRQ